MKKKRIPTEHPASKVFEHFGDWNAGGFSQVSDPFLAELAASINALVPDNVEYEMWVRDNAITIAFAKHSDVDATAVKARVLETAGRTKGLWSVEIKSA